MVAFHLGFNPFRVVPTHKEPRVGPTGPTLGYTITTLSGLPVRVLIKRSFPRTFNSP
jgi:hypothetical protein